MKKSKLMALAAIVLSGALALSGCGNASSSSSSSSSSAKSDSSSSAAAPSEASGFEEVPVGPSGTAEEQDKAAGPLTVGAVYFQPIDMEPAGMGLKAADASFHLEADIHASQEGTDYGYGKGDFVPDLTVNYQIIDKSTGKQVEGTATSGTFMQMNASDGPHYGANVKLDKAGTYQLKLSIQSPEKKGWMLHVDPETGVKNHKFWTEPIEVTFDNWDYTPRQW
ncbi:iron transporter [Bifidobacterium simiarum]|uniref:iron transporter n=1 Tax=Bifidobacterium simiarum TaxID=2045441 RepID=UPI001BDC0023|nr:iron transporter [Bifidobacterium simiarum]MBT1167034.1 iron transporter [Bifidobacterium simiarum]